MSPEIQKSIQAQFGEIVCDGECCSIKQDLPTETSPESVVNVAPGQLEAQNQISSLIEFEDEPQTQQIQGHNILEPSSAGKQNGTNPIGSYVVKPQVRLPPSTTSKHLVDEDKDASKRTPPHKSAKPLPKEPAFVADLEQRNNNANQEFHSAADWSVLSLVYEAHIRELEDRFQSIFDEVMDILCIRGAVNKDCGWCVGLRDVIVAAMALENGRARWTQRAL